MVKRARNTYQKNYLSDSQKHAKRGGFRRTLGALLLAAAGFSILTGCPPPFNPIPPKPATTTEQTTASDPAPSTPPTDPTKPSDPIANQSYVTISGVLQDDEDHETPSQLNYTGEVQLFQLGSNVPLSDINGQTIFYTDSNGHFNIQLYSNLDISDLTLKARMFDSKGNPASAQRVIDNLPFGNISSSTDFRMDPAVRVVPYKNINDLNKDGKVNQTDYSLFAQFVDGIENSTLNKYKISHIAIIQTDPYEGQSTPIDPTVAETAFNTAKNALSTVTQKILNCGGPSIDINSYLDFNALNLSKGKTIVQISKNAYTGFSEGDVVPSSGYAILVVVDPTDDHLKNPVGGYFDAATQCLNAGTSGVNYDSAVIYLSSAKLTDPGLEALVFHEGEHATIAPNDDITVLTSEQTTYDPQVNSTNTNFKLIDDKETNISYDQTYQPNEPISDIVN